MTARLTLRLVLLAIVAFVVGLVVARGLFRPAAVPVPATENATIFVPPRALPPLALVDADGKPLGPRFLEGHWTLVFFGFTHCPDVCPTTLTVLGQVHKLLGSMPAGRQPRVLLVTVDPERDTPQRLRDYVRFFDPAFTGATGTPEAIRQAAAAFAVPYAKVPLPGGGYTMDHGAGVFTVGPAGQVVAYSSPPLSADVLARDFRKTVQYVEDPQ
ncbi:MAG TPA: SCO family protein [Steroidobacteraceae bacterium]